MPGTNLEIVSHNVLWYKHSFRMDWLHRRNGVMTSCIVFTCICLCLYSMHTLSITNFINVTNTSFTNEANYVLLGRALSIYSQIFTNKSWVKMQPLVLNDLKDAISKHTVIVIANDSVGTSTFLFLTYRSSSETDILGILPFVTSAWYGLNVAKKTLFPSYSYSWMRIEAHLHYQSGSLLE